LRFRYEQPPSNARYYWLLLAESHLTRRLFQGDGGKDCRLAGGDGVASPNGRRSSVCCALFDAGTGLGDTPLTVAVPLATVKLKALELCAPGFTTATVQVPTPLRLLNAGSMSWPAFTNVVPWPG
jgi:hypothetical protein